MKIPKIIYSTWISDKPLPEKFRKYIDSWKKFLPEYEIRMISLSNVPHNAFIDYFIREKKFAVAAQYARCKNLFDTGGLYFDIDIEVIRSFEDLMYFEFFAGIESDNVNHFVNNAIFGAVKGHVFLKECMVYMDKIDVNLDEIEVNTGPLMFTKIMKDNGWIPANKNCYRSVDNVWTDGISKPGEGNEIQLFNSKYFYPYFHTEQYTPDCITSDTFAVHHWAATWKNSVSVIIPSDNYSGPLDKIIECALNQTILPIEVIIVFSGTPEKGMLIRELAANYKIKVIEIEKGGLSYTLNAGVEFSKGRWILILNADLEIIPTYIEKTIDTDDLVACQVPVREMGGSIQSGIWNNQSLDIGSGENLRICTLFRKEIWESINGFDEMIDDAGAEKDFITRAVIKGFKITWI